MLNRYLLKISILTIAFTPSPLLMGTDKSQEVAQTELQKLYSSAQSAMQGEQWGRAREYYRTLLRQGVDRGVDTSTYYETILQLALAEEKLGNFDAASSLLDGALQKELPEEFYRPAMFALARVVLQEGQPRQALLILNELERWVPKSDWAREERTFALSLRMSVHQLFSDRFEEAEHLLQNGSYEEAVPLFQEILAATQVGVCGFEEEEGKLKNLIRLRLAEALYQSGSYAEARSVLTIRQEECGEQEKGYNTEEGQQALYLLGLCCQELGDSKAAVACFQDYLSLQSEPNEQWEQAVWECGLALYRGGELEEAKSFFQRLGRHGKNQKLHHLSQIYLARLYLDTGAHEEVVPLLHRLDALLTVDNPLRYEVAYLQGEAAYREGNYLLAARQFEESIPKRNQEKAKWFTSALHNLGWSYLHLGDDDSRETPSQSAFLFKAEQAFKRLISVNRSEEAYLALGRVYLAKAKRLRDREATQKAEALLSQPHLFTSLDSRAEALLLRTQAVRDFKIRDTLYRELTDPIYQETALYGEGWYSRGLNQFEQGERLRQRGDQATATPYYQRAAQALLQSFEIFKNDNSERAAQALKFTAQAYYNQGTRESRKLAYSMLDTLFQEHPNLIEQMEGRDELLYIRGLMASVLLAETHDEHYLSTAETALCQVKADYPNSRYAASALHVLGTMYFHQGDYATAEEAFVHLAKEYPDSRYAGDAWFWAGECADWQQKDDEQVRNYRRQVYEHYGNSFFAAEAYFNTYSFTEYLQGKPEALEHLRAMQERYPESPYLVVGHYLIGLDCKQERRSLHDDLIHGKELEGALQAFTSACTQFEQCQSEGQIISANLEYFTTILYKARLESGLTRLALSQQYEGTARRQVLEQAEQELEELTGELSDGDHPLARLVTRGQAYPRILEEAQFGLAEVYLEAKDDVAAERTLRAMLARHDSAQISRGYYPSRVWYEIGCIAMRRGEYSVALEHFDRAEECANQGVLSRDQQLDLWIQKAICHRARNELNDSMLMLSRVINDESSSSLRMRAMYLRAEIYELQGRQELAIKQLEATARKGGLWASKAKEKLRREYGFH